MKAARAALDITELQNAIDVVLAFGSLAPLAQFARPEVTDELRITYIGKPQKFHRMSAMRIDAEMLRRARFSKPDIVGALLIVHCNGDHTNNQATLAAAFDGGRVITSHAKRWIKHFETTDRIAARQRTLFDMVTTSKSRR